MILSIDDAVQAVSERLGREITRQELAFAYLEVDQEAVEEAVRSSIRYEVWDQESPINGRPAEEVKRRRADLGEAAYLIYVDDQLKFFQPTDPVTGTILDQRQVHSAASKHAESLCQQYARDEIIASLIRTSEIQAPPDELR